MSRQVLADVVRAYAAAAATLDDLMASSHRLEAAQDALVRVQGRFEDGRASFCDVLQCQSTLIKAQRSRTRCIAQWRSARTRMLASAGGLDRADMHAAQPVRVGMNAAQGRLS